MPVAATNHIRSLIKSFAGQAAVLTTPRVFVQALKGDHIAALLLSQILYWTDRTDDPDGWFYKTADEWADELCISYAQLKRAAAKLQRFGVEVTLRKVYGAPRLHFRIDLDQCERLILDFLENQQSRKSTNSKVEIQESAISMDIQESAKTIDHKITHEITSSSGSGMRAHAREAPSQTPEQPPPPPPLSPALEQLASDTLKPNGQLTATERRRLLAMQASYSANWLELALTEALNANVPKLGYVESILKRAAADGRPPGSPKPNRGTDDRRDDHPANVSTGRAATYRTRAPIRDLDPSGW